MNVVTSIFLCNLTASVDMSCSVLFGFFTMVPDKLSGKYKSIATCIVDFPTLYLTCTVAWELCPTEGAREMDHISFIV